MRKEIKPAEILENILNIEVQPVEDCRGGKCRH